MTNSNSSSSLLTPVRRIWVFGVLAAAGVGFADALYLVVNHYQQVIPPCVVGSCESVLTSRFATIAGIPLSLIGLIAYTLIVFLCLLYIDRGHRRLLKWIAILGAISFVVSVVLVGIQLFVLHAICQYCMISAICDTVLFGCTIPFWRR